VYQDNAGQWWAAIYVGRKRVRVRCQSEDHADATATALIELHRHEVGRMYHLVRTGQVTPPIRGRASRERGRFQRAGVSISVRFAVFERDAFRCSYCGATPQDARMVVDHIVPIADGGTDAMENLTTACQACNAGKAARRLEVLPGGLSA
jgi:5-methylcytosine-specific restriction endonuclease McrA